VAAVGVIREPGFAEGLIEGDEADLVVLGRTLLADPDWPEKARAGEIERIRRCIGWGEGVMARHGEDQPIRCGVNATVGRDEAFSRLKGTEHPKRVLVIGGGPAGMEAARVAAARGHSVTLLEKEEHLGGALRMAAVPPGKRKIRWLIEYYEAELARLGVEVRLGRVATRELVEKMQPDVIVLSTGSICPVPDIPGADLPCVVTAMDALAGKVEITAKRVTVVGGGMIGLETALFLSTRGNSVTVLKRYKTIARSLEPIYRDHLLRELKDRGVKITSEVEVIRVNEGSVTIRDVRGKPSDLPSDMVVLARDPVPERDTLQELEGLPVIPIGDCVRPGKIVDAVREGYSEGRSL